MLDIAIEQADFKSGMVPVTWCVSPDVLEEIKDKDPHLLLVVVNLDREYNQYDEERYVVPLKNLMAYVTFSRAGNTRIYAQLITREEGQTRKQLERAWKNVRYLEESDIINRWGVDFRNTTSALRVELKEWNVQRDQETRRLEQLFAEEPDEAVETFWREKRKYLKSAYEGLCETEDGFKEEYSLEQYARNNVREELESSIGYYRGKINTCRNVQIPEAKRMEGFRTSINVEVPADHFAPEPSPGMKRWVNHFFDSTASGRPVDECAFRRRKWFFAMHIQVVLVLCIQVVRLLLVAIFAGCLGLRGVKFTPLISPLEETTGDVLGTLTNAVWLPKLNESMFRWFLLPFFPVGMIISLIPATVALYHPAFDAMSLLDQIGILIAIGTGLIAATMALIMAIAFVIGVLFPSIGTGLERLFEMMLDKLSPSPEELAAITDEDMQYLICETAPRPRTYGDLPKNRRTWKLRFLSLKKDLCRPFQR